METTTCHREDLAKQRALHSPESDVHEFERLKRRAYNYTYRIAFRMTGNAVDAEDATQEAFIRAWLSFGRYNRARSFEGWVFRILSNLVIDRWRRVSRAQIFSLESARAVSNPSASGFGDDSSGAHLLGTLADENVSRLPEAALMRAEQGRRVRRALAALPGYYSQVVVLADVRGYSYEEIANQFECPVGTVRSRLYRGRQLLRQHLLAQEEKEREENKTCYAS